MRKTTGARTDAALAQRLSVSNPTVAAWRRRGSIPFAECVRLAIEERESLDWLIFGKRSGSQPGIHDLGIDLEILAVVVLEEGELNELVAGVTDPWERSRFKARGIADKYRRYLGLMNEAISGSTLSRSEFIGMLRGVRANRPQSPKTRRPSKRASKPG